MITLINTSVILRKNVASIWTEGRKLAVGFKHGDYFRVETDFDKKEVTFVRDVNGDCFVSKRTGKDGSILPLIEFKDNVLSEIFEVGMKIRIVVKEGIAVISVHGHHNEAVKRTTRFLEKVLKGEPLQVGSLFTGGGVLDRAIHEGLKLAGVNSYLKVALESDVRYVDALLKNQADLFRDDSIVINSLIEDLEIKRDFSLEIVVCGLPCLGASPAGKSKLKISHAEQHPQAGNCFFHTLNFIKASNPAVVVIENVKAFESEMSFVVMESVLSHWGYDVHKTILNSNDYGTLENRDRLGAVAISKELNGFSFTDFVFPLKAKESSLNEFIVELASDDKQWRSYDYLVTKEASDKKAGKGFRRALYDGSEPSISTIRRLYHKGGSCDQYLKHPDYISNGLTRKFTATEHANFKGIPLFIIDGLNSTVSHEICGQSVCYPVFFSLGYGLGLHSLKSSGLIDSFTVVANDSEVNEVTFSDDCVKETFETVSVYLHSSSKLKEVA
ncbi:MAG: DNA cytosine methyltransferase [Cocleimonas sp.]